MTTSCQVSKKPSCAGNLIDQRGQDLHFSQHLHFYVKSIVIVIVIVIVFVIRVRSVPTGSRDVCTVTYSHTVIVIVRYISIGIVIALYTVIVIVLVLIVRRGFRSDFMLVAIMRCTILLCGLYL